MAKQNTPEEFIAIIESKIDGAKKALNEGKLNDALVALHAAELYAIKGNVNLPEEAKELKINSAIKLKIKEAKDAIADGEYEDALSGIAGIEIYAKKAGIPTPAESGDMRNEAYSIAINSKINEAKDLIEKNDPDALASLKVAIAYSKKANTPLPDEFDTLISNAYKSGIEGKINEAKESIENEEPQDALLALMVAEKYAKAAGIPTPEEVTILKKEAQTRGMTVMLNRVGESITAGEHADAIGQLGIVEKYVKELNIEIPAEVETLRKEIYNKYMGAKIEDAKEALKNGKYADAIGACNVIENLYAKKAGMETPAEVETLRNDAYRVGVEEKIKETKDAIADGEYEDALSGITGIEIYAKKAGIPLLDEIETLRKESYKTAVNSKISEANNLINENNPDALAALKVAIAYSKKADMPIPGEIDSLMPKAYEAAMNGKINESRESIENEEPQDALVALIVSEKYAKIAGVFVPEEVEKLRKEAQEKGINVMINRAKVAITDGEYGDALGPLTIAEKYAKNLNMDVPAEVEALRKDAYKKGVETKISEAKEALKDGEYADVIGACGVIENIYTKKAGIPMPSEVESLRNEAYKIAVTGKIKETKDAIAEGEYEDALSGLAGIEIYAKKAGIPIPSEVGDLRKESYKTAVNGKINEAKALIEENNPDALASLKVAIAYSKKADIPISEEINTLMIEAYKVTMNGRINEAKEAIENEEPQDALVALIVSEKYAKEAGIPAPLEIEALKKEAQKAGINVMINRAKIAITDGEFGDALGPLSIAEKYAKASGIPAPAEVEALRKDAYKKGVETKISEAKEALKDGEYGDVIGACGVIENMYAKKAGIPTPVEVETLRNESYKMGVAGKITETRNAIAEGEYEDALSGLAGVEIYAKKAGIPVPDEIEDLRKETYKTAVNGKISEAKDLIEENDPDALASLKVAIAYSRKADIPISEEINTLMIEAYKVTMNGKINEAKEAIENEEPQDALVALIVSEKYAKESGIPSPAEIEALKKEAQETGITVMINRARLAITDGEFGDALGPLSIAEKYAKAAGIPAPAEVETLRKEAYKKGVDTKLAEAKEALKDGKYADVIGACGVIENMYAKKASIPVPDEVENLRNEAYKMGVTEKIKETKDAIAEGEFEDALSGLAGIEIYAKKAGIPVPDETEDLRKETYKTAVNGKIAEAKDLIEENDPDALASLKVAIAYSKKADIPIPEEIDLLMPEAYEVSMNGKINEAKEAIENEEPQDALVALIVSEKYAKEAGIPSPLEIEALKKEAQETGINVMINRAKVAITDGEFGDALGPLTIAEKYAKNLNISIPAEIETLRKDAYKKGVETKLAEAKEALNNGEYADVIGACGVIENIYAKKAGIPTPSEVESLRTEAYKIGVTGKIKETKDA
ncbi:MAG: hypothetical protein CVT90_00495, partial [Candidatus Altiarchaeales archaeon HGW-Altiarchaeales-3]